MRTFILFVTLFVCCSVIGKAQGVTGKVSDSKNNNLKNVSVSLLKAADSSIQKIEVTNEQGIYEFKDIPAGSYLITINDKKYDLYYSSVITVADAVVQAEPIMVNTKPVNNSDVLVRSRKPLIEVKADKMILNVENSINSVGSDALELLRKSPGVIVDKDDNLSLSGKNGVRVYIDGKPSPLSGADLAAYLKSLQSSQIEAIEIIKNPSAKYDAAGNAGIINIRLKKNKTLGTNGSANAGYAIGVYSKLNAGLNLNNRNKASNIFGNINVNKSKNENNFNLSRTLFDTSFNQRNVMTTKNETVSYKVGADFYISKKSTLGFVVNGGVDKDDMLSDSRTPIIFVPTNFSNRTLLAQNVTDAKNNNINFNVNYIYTDTSGRNFSMDADYGIYKLDNNQTQPNLYVNPTTGVKIDEVIYNMVPNTEIKLGTIKADYEQNLKGGKLGVGIKSAFIKTDNLFDRFNVFATGKILDTLRSNNFYYDENINAAYVNYNKQLKSGWMYQLGLRTEHTNTKGTSTGYAANSNGTYKTYDSTFTRDYINLFPSAAITYNKNPMSQWTFSYSRRIDRPAYKDLNPFEFKLDEYTFQKGNTNLRPQYTNSFSVSNTFKYFLTTSLEYSHITDVFTQLVDTQEISKSFISNQNLATQDSWSLNISSPLQFGKYSGFINVSNNVSRYKANFGQGRTVNLSAYQFSMYSDNSYKLTKTTTAQLSGWFAGPGIWGGTFRSKAMGGFDIGFMKQLWNNKANIKLTLTDVMRTMKWAGNSNFAGQVINVNGNWESRQLRVNFTYRFGSNQIKASSRRDKANEAETKRLKSSGGLGGN
jgi:iron complex outermembrane recepter protein